MRIVRTIIFIAVGGLLGAAVFTHFHANVLIGVVGCAFVGFLASIAVSQSGGDERAKFKKLFGFYPNPEGSHARTMELGRIEYERQTLLGRLHAIAAETERRADMFSLTPPTDSKSIDSHNAFMRGQMMAADAIQQQVDEISRLAVLFGYWESPKAEAAEATASVGAPAPDNGVVVPKPVPEAVAQPQAV